MGNLLNFRKRIAKSEVTKLFVECSQQAFIDLLNSGNGELHVGPSIERAKAPSILFPGIDKSLPNGQGQRGRHQLFSQLFLLSHRGSELNLEFLRGVSLGFDVRGVRCFLGHRGGGPHTGKTDNQHLTNDGHEELREV